jgi:hypothetical protein
VVISSRSPISPIASRQTENCRSRDVVDYAYERCQANRGAAGVDNQTFARHRTVRQGAVVGGADARAEESNLATATRAVSVYTKAGWEAETVRAPGCYA